MQPTSLTLTPIGFIRSAKHAKFQAGHQPAPEDLEHSMLELVDGREFDLALRDLAGFSRIWVVSWFDRNTQWRPLVLPPRGPKHRRGVFATRSPHRPNPLGLSAVELISVDARHRRLVLGACDLLAGTPVFDIKPYIPAYDAFPQASTGWIAEVDAAMAESPQFEVVFSPLAQTQADWLAEYWAVDFRPKMQELLARDPSPHRTRRIRQRAEGWCEIGCGAWRGYFTVAGAQVVVASLDAGYPRLWLDDATLEDVPDRAAQAAFLTRWPSPYGEGKPRSPTRDAGDADPAR